MSIETDERGGTRLGGTLRTLGSDSVGHVSGQLGGRTVYRILCIGRVEGLEIGRVLGYRGWELWKRFVVETCEDLFV